MTWRASCDEEGTACNAVAILNLVLDEIRTNSWPRDNLVFHGWGNIVVAVVTAWGREDTEAEAQDVAGHPLADAEIEEFFVGRAAREGLALDLIELQIGQDYELRGEH